MYTNIGCDQYYMEINLILSQKLNSRSIFFIEMSHFLRFLFSWRQNFSAHLRIISRLDRMKYEKMELFGKLKN